MSISIMAGISGQVTKSVPFMMVSRNFHIILRRLRINTSTQIRKFSSAKEETDEADPAPFFFNQEVQKILKTLTRPDLNKIFRARMDGRPIEDATYKFMTDAELKKAMAEIECKVEEKLQMPPVLKKRKPINSVLASNPEIQEFDDGVKYVFTDITFPDVSNVDRLIVVREPEGILRHANWDERCRLTQIYFPIEGREIVTPAMFSGEYFEDLLRREELEFLLDRACIQFEPDDPEYIRITQIVYNTINELKQFNRFRSTRHYGPLVFHLVWTKNIYNLLYENIQCCYIEDAALLIQLYHKVHPSESFAEDIKDQDYVRIVEIFIDLRGEEAGKVKAALNAYKEFEKSRRDFQEGVKVAHGRK